MGLIRYVGGAVAARRFQNAWETSTCTHALRVHSALSGLFLLKNTSNGPQTWHPVSSIYSQHILKMVVCTPTKRLV